VPESSSHVRRRRTRQAWRITAGTVGAGAAATLIVVGALLVGLFAVGVALVGAVRPTVLPVPAEAARAATRSRVAARPKTAADEAGL